MMPQVNVLSNGGFETGNLASWYSQYTTVTNTYSHSGYYSARLSGGAVNSYISQFVPVQAGENLEVQYALSKVGSSPNPLVSLSISYYDDAYNYLSSGLIINNYMSRIPDVTSEGWIELANVSSPAPPAQPKR